MDSVPVVSPRQGIILAAPITVRTEPMAQKSSREYDARRFSVWGDRNGWSFRARGSDDLVERWFIKKCSGQEVLRSAQTEIPR